MATKTKKHKGKGAVERVVESAVDATEELGAAATAFRESWGHIKKAQSKGKPATHAVARTARQASRATVKAAKRVLPGKKKRGKK